MHTMPNISKSKDDRMMKFGQLVVCNRRHILSKNHEENEAGRLVLDLFLFFQKALHKVKASGLQLSFLTFGLNLAYNKNKLFKTLDL